MRTLAITTCAFLGVTLTPLLSGATLLSPHSSGGFNQAANTNRSGSASGSRASNAGASQSNSGRKKQTETKNADAGKAATGRKVDLNSGSQADLESLPGVGPATARKIIAGRPYSSVADLSKAGVPAKTIDSLSGMVTVGSTPAAPASNAAPSAPGNTAKRASASPATGQTGGPGMVWVNPDTKVFHRYGSRWYGKTKTGQYMTEADAMKAGYRESKQAGSSK
jgi:DNA uptake protein ComE-like DNA-binding protein